jgi:hypothetical protein
VSFYGLFGIKFKNYHWNSFQIKTKRWIMKINNRIQASKVFLLALSLLFATCDVEAISIK